MNLFWLLFAHFLFDAGLQPDWMLQGKQKSWFVLFEHSFIYAGGVSLALVLLKSFQPYEAVLLLLSHYVIDVLKIVSSENPLDEAALYRDQTMHVIILMLCLLW